MNKYYVYKHTSALSGEIFYIGKGTGTRFKQKTRRNAYWHNVAKAGFKSEIIKNNLKEEEALKLEIELIQQLNPKTNLSLGGEYGKSGYKTPLEVKEKIKASNKNNKSLCKKRFMCVEDLICFYSLSDAAIYYNASKTGIQRVLKKLRNSIYGKTFTYLEEKK